MTPAPTPLAAAALARNDRYLREFIEALSICPFAKQCRETGLLHREVLEQSAPDVGAVVAAVHGIEALGEGAVEVGLLLLPALRIEARPFEHFVRAVRQAYEAGRTTPVAFFLVAFHPDMAMDLTNADRAVAFLRRSPDPTIQLVSVGTLTKAKEGAGDRRRLSEAIAEAGLAAIQTAGPEAVAALLGSMRAGAAPGDH